MSTSPLAFAARPAQCVDQERHRVVRQSLALLVEHGQSAHSHVVQLLLDSCHRQARWSAGIEREIV